MNSIVAKDDTARPAGSGVFAAGGLRVRAFSALVLALPALAAVHFGSPYFDLLLVVVATLMAMEWDRLCAGPGRNPSRPQRGGFDAVTWMFIALVFATTAVVAVGWYAQGLLLAGGGFAAVYLIARGRRRPAPLLTAIGVFYICLPVLALIWLRGDAEFGRVTIYWLLALVWATDTGAFLAGRTIGGPKLAPSISPNKTWAGLAGGVLSAAGVGLAAAGLAQAPSATVLAVVSAALAIVSQGGDLVESGIKRRIGVKDSGGLIPGHGGFFDRVDGLLVAAPVLAVFVLVVGSEALWR